MAPKNQVIIFRIDEQKKAQWQSHCRKRNLTLSEYIINAVEGDIGSNERRSLINFIEHQDNIFSKVQTNINQFAKIANIQKKINETQLEKFQLQLDEVIRLKMKQNQMFKDIFQFLAHNT